ncbi:hypothetical protein GTO89_02305 [Heliobacterium gestii]|uniref:Uncharacterized protein n=1 Tax=Heliomicrobium gestii TaxID=2699 RepID=A0A845L9D5_HELGE|nr:hypothetical protein [Heliomicrobium gestii]MBM7865614.1 hypothetical protein [Heliomicrobium gestii]MZP41864.1 hypothetical protein [Heliomicrobium gestii]
MEKPGIDVRPSLHYLERVLRQNKAKGGVVRCFFYRQRIGLLASKELSKKSVFQSKGM